MIFGSGGDFCLVGSAGTVQLHAVLSACDYPESPGVIQVMTGMSSVSDSENGVKEVRIRKFSS